MPKKNVLQRHRNLFLFLCGAMIGAVAFFLINTGASLNVTNDSWISTGYVEKDIVQHYSGWLMYRESPIAFPFGTIPSIGSAVSYTDSIPLAAIFFRLFSFLLPQTFQYFGIWVLLCYMLQGGAAALLLGLFSSQDLTVLAGSTLFVCSPIMIERAFRHTALASHFLILFALYLYFRNQKEGFRFRAGYLVLLGLATAIHPYFLPIIFAILFADLVQHAFAAREWKRPLGFLAAGFGVVLITGYSIGLFSVGSTELSYGYGYFCMNLNSLFNPTSLGGYTWSRVIGVRAQGLGSYDGFNYLGLAILLLLVPSALLRLWRGRSAGVLSLLKRHWGLLFVSLCLTAFAVSTTVLWGDTVLLQLSLPARLISLCSTFRSSGRMFYPVYYLLYLYVFSALARLSPRKARWLPTALIAAAALLQLWDLSPALAYKRSFFTDHREDCIYPLNSTVWQQAAAKHTRLSGPDGNVISPVYLGFYCAQNGLVDDFAFAARFDATRANARLAQSAAQIAAGAYDPETIYATSSRTDFLAITQSAGDDVWAVQVDELWYLLIPHAATETLALDDTSFLYPNLGLYVAPYNDVEVGWDSGVLQSDPCTLAFYDDAGSPDWNRVTSLTCDGTEYPVVSVSPLVDGYIAVTLQGVEDSDALRGYPFCASYDG